MVEIKNLTKYYGKNPAVRNLSFEVKDNEILGFLGPNGAGKSTTMNMIAGYLPSTSGTVTVEGFDITEQSVEAKKRIGYLPEIPPVYPDMRVEEYLKFVAGIKCIPSKKRLEQVEKAMERLRITDMRRRLIRNLSKGYKQRVGFAQALLGDPKILILDEPTVGFDPSQVIEVRNLILDLKQDHSIIFSSHILSEVSAVCERVVIINKGRIMAIDTIANLEKTLIDKTVLNLRVNGNRDKVVRLVKDVNGVVQVSDIVQIQQDQYTYKVEIRSEEVRSEIMKTLVNNDLEIVEMSLAKLDLEQVFLKLTQGSKKTSLADLLAETPENPETDTDSDNPYNAQEV